LKWDNSFSLSNSYHPYKETKFISISEYNEEEITMVYSTDVKFNSKKIRSLNGETISNKVSELISTGDKEDLKFSTSNTIYWIDKKFISYGYQKIKKDKSKRKVYYINLIGF
jgi:hypothetical protein